MRRGGERREDELGETDELAGYRATHVTVRQFHLRAVAGPDAGRVVASAGTRVVVGTHRSADLRLSDSTVSRCHCEVTVFEGRALVRDLGSRNGTRVDGTSVLGAYLEDGATLTLGRSQLRFEAGDEKVKIPLSPRDRFGLMVGRSRAMRAVFAQLERAAGSDLTLLLQGETGTGKDVAAESVHRESARRVGPFVVLDCGSIPVGLAESALFGHERGAFTGADHAHAGAFEEADGGTLFLDEIGELPLDLQPKLLRALETREVQRVGGRRRLPVDVRVVAATNRDLRSEMNAGRFRPDLYFRLAVLEVTLPPLRARPEDLPGLCDALLAGLGAEDAAARRVKLPADLARHPWPGNVRELRNYLERCVAMEETLSPGRAEPRDEPPVVDIRQPLKVAREAWLRAFERRYLAELLDRHGGKVTAAARAAGIDRIHFYRLMWRSGVKGPAAR